MPEVPSEAADKVTFSLPQEEQEKPSTPTVAATPASAAADSAQPPSLVCLCRVRRACGVVCGVCVVCGVRELTWAWSWTQASSWTTSSRCGRRGRWAREADERRRGSPEGRPPRTPNRRAPSRTTDQPTSPYKCRFYLFFLIIIIIMCLIYYNIYYLSLSLSVQQLVIVPCLTISGGRLVVPSSSSTSLHPGLAGDDGEHRRGALAGRTEKWQNRLVDKLVGR